jgi:hypothetical protein
VTRRIALALSTLAVAGVADASILHPRATDLAAEFKPFTLVLGPVRRLAYATHNGTLMLVESRDGKFVEIQKRYILESPVVRMLAADLNGDGQDEIVCYTQSARLFVLRGTDLQDIWVSPPGRFKNINALTVGDVDADGQPEIVLVADGLLRIYSAMQDVLEWQNTDPYNDTEIAIGDVDGDGKLEIVLNSGKVLDAVFREIEWTYTPGFGTQMELYDIDGDGKPEILGVGSDGLLRIFDVDEHRLKTD